MRSTSTEVIVENDDDKHKFTSVIGLPKTQVHLIPGVGVDMNQFFPANRSNSVNPRVGLVSRLIYHKGVLEFFEAAKLCKSTRPDVKFLLVGDTSPLISVLIKSIDPCSWSLKGTTCSKYSQLLLLSII